MIAETIRPDVVVFSDLEVKKNGRGLIRTGVEELKADLKPLGIAVEYYDLSEL